MYIVQPSENMLFFMFRIEFEIKTNYVYRLVLYVYIIILCIYWDSDIAPRLTLSWILLTAVARDTSLIYHMLPHNL